MVSHLWWALFFITACDSCQISCNSDFIDSTFFGGLVRRRFECSAELSTSFSKFFIAQMDVDIDDWTLISNPCPKSRPAPKPVPSFHFRPAASLSQPLSKGGKEVPKFERPNPYPVLQSPRRSNDMTVSGIHDISSVDVKMSKPVFLPAQAPRGSSAPQRPRVQGISVDLQRRWIALVHSIGNLSQVWSDFQGSTHFESHWLRLLDKFSNSTMFKYIAVCPQHSTGVLIDLAGHRDIQIVRLAANHARGAPDRLGIWRISSHQSTALVTEDFTNSGLEYFAWTSCQFSFESNNS